MLAGCSQMLTKCKVAKCGPWAFKRTIYHVICIKIRWNLENSKMINFSKFSWILHVFFEEFCIFQKMQKGMQIQIWIIQRIFAQITCKVVRLKAQGPYFAFLDFVSIHEHPASIYEQFWNRQKYAFFHHFWAIDKRKCSCLLRRCSKMLTRCKNAKYDVRAFQRTSSDIIWTKIRFKRTIWNVPQYYPKTADFR